MTWHDIIREARENARLSQADLAKLVGCSQATINKIENDKPQSSRYLLEILNQLKLSSAEIPSQAFGTAQQLATGERMIRNREAVLARKSISGFQDPSSWASETGLGKEIPIYAPYETAEGMIAIDNVIIETAIRLPILQGINGAYAISVYNETMQPECEPGDILFANHRQVVPPGSLCAFYSFKEQETHIMLSRYVGQSDDNWEIIQHNPQIKLNLRKDLWPVRHRIVAKIFR